MQRSQHNVTQLVPVQGVYVSKLKTLSGGKEGERVSAISWTWAVYSYPFYDENVRMI